MTPSPRPPLPTPTPPPAHPSVAHASAVRPTHTLYFLLYFSVRLFSFEYNPTSNSSSQHYDDDVYEGYESDDDYYGYDYPEDSDAAPHYTTGLLELFTDGLWTPFCTNNNFGWTEAIVACRCIQLIPIWTLHVYDYPLIIMTIKQVYTNFQFGGGGRNFMTFLLFYKYGAPTSRSK